ncbi:hypothetical protein PJL15_02761 [Paenarthrobacter nitroguajacolicus]|nr:hypothetical protein [Paenarthrobacter nitroguajacolicus]
MTFDANQQHIETTTLAPASPGNILERTPSHVR